MVYISIVSAWYSIYTLKFTNEKTSNTHHKSMRQLWSKNWLHNDNKLCVRHIGEATFNKNFCSTNQLECISKWHLMKYSTTIGYYPWHTATTTDGQQEIMLNTLHFNVRYCYTIRPFSIHVKHTKHVKHYTHTQLLDQSCNTNGAYCFNQLIDWL